MGRFFRENWLWIVLPFLVDVGGMVLILVMTGSDEGAAPFQYQVF